MLHSARLLLVLLAPLPVALAQTKTASTGQVTYSAPKTIIRAGGVRLEGTVKEPARVSSNAPQFSVVAPLIAFDLGNNTVSQVRASGGVSLKLSVVQKRNVLDASGRKTSVPVKVYVEAQAQNAVLTSATHTLELRGNLSGFTRSGDGPPTRLSGDSATLRFANAALSGDVEDPSLSLAPEILNLPATLGPLSVTAQRGQFDQSANSTTLSGNARIASNGNPGDKPEERTAFNLSASQIVLKRGDAANSSSLSTQGKTRVVYDFPRPPKDSAAIVAQTGDGANKRTDVGVPVHVEVVSDGAVFDGATSKARFSGNVSGFYRLQSGDKTRDFPFSGDQATLFFDREAAAKAAQEARTPEEKRLANQSALNIEVTGKPGEPVSIAAPAFEF
jgi:lipopolysaccharide export system protein LptA